MDEWDELRLMASGLSAQLAGVLDQMIADADEDEDLTFLVDARYRALNIADFLSPPGEPEDGYSAPVVSLDKYRAKMGR